MVIFYNTFNIMTLHSGTFSCNENDWDEQQYCHCKPGERIWSVDSYHNNYREDRKWQIGKVYILGICKLLVSLLFTANVYKALRGVCRFSLHYLWKRAIRITEKPSTPKREKKLYVVGKPFNIYRLRRNPHDSYRISPHSVNITGIPHNIHNLSL